MGPGVFSDYRGGVGGIAGPGTCLVVGAVCYGA